MCGIIWIVDFGLRRQGNYWTKKLPPYRDGKERDERGVGKWNDPCTCAYVRRFDYYNELCSFNQRQTCSWFKPIHFSLHANNEIQPYSLIPVPPPLCSIFRLLSLIFSLALLYHDLWLSFNIYITNKTYLLKVKRTVLLHTISHNLKSLFLTICAITNH